MRDLRLPLLLFALSVFAAGCGSSSAPDFQIAAAPAAVTLQNGGSARLLSVTASATGGFSSPVNVSLSGLPAGVTATPSTLSVTPGKLAQFKLTASSSAAATTSATVTVTGSAGSLSHTAVAAITVSPAPAPDFSITAAPSTLTLQSGGAGGSLSVTAAAVNGFTDAVNVSLSGLPAGVTATPSTLSVAPGQLAQFTLTASNSAAPISSATITVTGSADSLTHTATAALSISAAVVPDFTISSLPASITMTSGGSNRSLTVSAAPVNGFADPVSVSLSGLPAGVTATPSTLSVTPGQVGQFILTASSSAAAVSGATITLTGSADSLSHTSTAALSIVPPVSNASLSATSYDFGGNLVGSTLTKSAVVLTNTGASAITLSPSISGDSSFSIAAGSCGATLSAGASCTESVNYTPTVASGSTPQTATLNLNLGNVPSGTAQTVALTGTSTTLAQGTTTTTSNPQVALYTMTLPFPGSVTVNFGKDTTYGLKTWTKSTTQAGGTVSIYVAGMVGNTTYHMQASVQFENGLTTTDVDHTFTTGAAPVTPNIAVTATNGLTPQSGVEEMATVIGAKGIIVTDLQGNVIWTYNPPNMPSSEEIDGVKLLPNGDFLITLGEGNTYTFGNGAPQAGAILAIREIDLAGNIVRELTLQDLNDELQAAGHNIVLQQFHHDITPLPNGHWLILSNTTQTRNDITGYPANTTVLGDVVIDVDQNMQPVWVWNEFDHLDINRHPMAFPDWTHSNAIVYTPDDHNILVSIRHQNWVVKVDYQDGTGSGNILWRLGEGGDFTLKGGVDPTDWQYAQHAPSIVGPTSAGVFSLTMMDNGTDREFPDGTNCFNNTGPCYSTIPVFQIDETAMTATLTFHQQIAPALYNAWGGNAEQLANGDYEYDLSGVGSDSYIFEVTPDSANPTTVWEMHVTGSNAYRGFRIPSLYPGVQW